MIRIKRFDYYFYLPQFYKEFYINFDEEQENHIFQYIYQ